MNSDKTMTLQKLANNPCPIWLLPYPVGFERKNLATELEANLGKLFPEDALVPLLFRGVGSDRLPTIMKTGCDVEPSDAPLFVGPLTKALEYANDGDQIIQIFRAPLLLPSWQEWPASTALDDLAEVQRSYPTVLHTEDKAWSFFSRLPQGNPRLASPYEREYGFWIPGNAHLALAGVIIITEDVDQFTAFLTNLVGS